MLTTSLLNSLEDRQVVDLALKEKLDFALFRMPGQCSATMYVSDEIDADFSKYDKAFVIAPFSNDREVVIPGKYCREMQIADGNINKCGVPVVLDMPNKYSESVSRIVSRLRKEGGKTVLATMHHGRCPHSVYDAFMRLATTYPDAFVFCWFLQSEPGVWMGASPELLVETDSCTIHTMALAGTRAADIDEIIPWDTKNIEEQQMVTAYIAQVMQQHGLVPQASAPYSKRAGNIAHICTEISATVPPGFDLRAFLKNMAPTPAVSGLPREKALKEILQCETFARKYYAGYCGVKTEAYIRLFVTLRCMNMTPESGDCQLYAGSGITALSVASDEWQEVNAKASTLSNALDITLTPTIESNYNNL